MLDENNYLGRINSFTYQDWHPFIKLTHKIEKTPILVNWESLKQLKLDIPMKCKLITAIVRNDRFCEGALVSAFNSGLILNILKSIEKEINSNNVN